MMGDSSEQRHGTEYSAFAAQWLAPLVAVFLRAVRDATLSYDLATETLATARVRWESAPAGDARVEWLVRLGGSVLDATVDRGQVPASERRRGREPVSRRLTVAEQREIAALAEQYIEIPDLARDAADALARMAPARHVLARLRGSGLVQAEPLSGALTSEGKTSNGA